ncbi:MAG: hypothetical protein CM15mP64_5470 [Candidatus Neomarinimicrobiota bacterium]|nr:MAG: hypothetical protein CM15mP64_5470 [Candidatus Neomarinimicrobiota bacterium]
MEKRLEREGNLVRAKTGGLSGVSNLSGYIYSPKYGPLAFSIPYSGYTVVLTRLSNFRIK